MSKDKELPTDFKVDEKIAAEIKIQLDDGKLSCVKAHQIAKQFKVSPALIGHTVDALEIRLTKCQLGLYGYPNKKGWTAAGVTEMEIPQDFAQALKSLYGNKGQLNCVEMWQLAAQYRVSRMRAGYIAEKLDIRIVSCQLGAF